MVNFKAFILPTLTQNVKTEFFSLTETLKNNNVNWNIPEFSQLKEVNRQLWEIEDRIRIKEANQEFDEEFIKLARSVYFENDKRAAIKKEINIKFGSNLIEEKEYVDYKK